jgi:hypothetical protein
MPTVKNYYEQGFENTLWIYSDLSENLPPLTALELTKRTVSTVSMEILEDSQEAFEFFSNISMFMKGRQQAISVLEAQANNHQETVAHVYKSYFAELPKGGLFTRVKNELSRLFRKKKRYGNN